MKRVGNLIESIASSENLELAFYKAAKGKWHKKEVQDFSSNIEGELDELRLHLLQGNLPVGKYRFFEIFDPKQRTIAVAPFAHRVAHHAIMNVCDVYFDNKQIFHSYACRKGKGSVAALAYVQENIDSSKWYLKMDVRRYFNSIPHQILLDNLKSIFKDEKLLSVFEFIISKYPSDNGKGIPIGNLTSQYFANHFLNKVDRFIKETLKVTYYVRYMDDMLLFNLGKEDAKCIENEIRKFLVKELHLELKISQLNRNAVGIPFLGYRVFKHRVRLGKVARSRFSKRMKYYKKAYLIGNISEKHASVCSRALLAFAERADILSLKEKIKLAHGSYL